MSERERWIVYPLLLMTLGIVLRDKLAGATNLRAQRVTCSKLTFVDENDEQGVTIDVADSRALFKGFERDGHRQYPSWMLTWPLLDPRLHHQMEPSDDPQNSATDGQKEPRTK